MSFTNARLVMFLMVCGANLCCVLMAQVANGQVKPAEAEEVLLSMPEPPEGYVVVKQPVKDGEKAFGWNVIVIKDGSPNRVVISVETAFDRSSRDARVAATKGYVNGTVETLKNSGLEVSDLKLPDLEKNTFTKPIGVQLSFKQADGTKVMLQQIIFFTDKGFNIQIAAADKEDLEALTKWARLVKPAGTAAKAKGL